MMWAALVYAQQGTPTNSSRWINECIVKKTTYANTIHERKLLVVAGSNALFGISSKMVENELNIPSVNMAVHAGLGLDYILGQSKKVINPGDIVILALEYEHYDYDGSPSSTLIDYVVSCDFSYATQKPINETGKFIFGMDVSRLREGLNNKFILHGGVPRYGYQSNTLNINGDETYHKIENSKSIKFLSKLDATKPLTKGIKDNTKAWSVLDNFIEWCNQNNVTLLVTYPSILYNDAYFSNNAIESINKIETFWISRGVRIVGKYDDFIYKPEYFYDTIYHLNNAGMEKRTSTLINYLRDIIYDVR